MIVGFARRVGWLLVLFPLLLTGTGAARAEDAEWRIEGKLFGKTEAGGFKSAHDVSGIACADGPLPRLCLIADDEAQGAQIVIAKHRNGEAGAFIPLTSERFEGKPLSFDAEGVAYADGVFYVVGSHGRPRHEKGVDLAMEQARAKATWKLFAIRFPPGSVNRSGDLRGPRPSVVDSADLPAYLKSIPALAAAFDKPLAEHGLNIEGVAVRGGMLFAGLRSPAVEGKGTVVAVPLDALFNGKAGRASLITVDLGKDSHGEPRGVRDLVAYGPDFLVLAGPQIDPPPGRPIAYGDYAIFRATEIGTTTLLSTLPAFGVEAKPEALMPLDQEGRRLRAVLLFDGPKDGGGRVISLEVH